MLVGQNRIVDQLNLILPFLYDTGGGHNFLLRAKSGYGKTHLGKLMCNYLVGRDYQYILPKDGVVPEFVRRCVFIDEVHLLGEPESIYPLMDSGRFVFILATNEAARLKEPLVNRCTVFTFEEYSRDELREIIDGVLSFAHTTDDLDAIIEAGNSIPRVCKEIASRLNIFSTRDTINVRDVIENLLGIRNGLDSMMRGYMELLQRSGHASKQTIKMSLGIDEDTLNQVESVLMRRGIVKITSRGRTL